MIVLRRLRTCIWILVIAELVALLLLVPWPDSAGGAFEVRARRRAELRAPVAGFLAEVHHDEGAFVPANDVVARLEIPDLASRTEGKRAELREADARLKLLRAGPRLEEIAQQQRRIAAVKAWRDVARSDLHKQNEVLQQDLTRMDKLLAEYRAISDFTQQIVARHERLRQSNSMSELEHLSARKDSLVASAQYERIVAERASRAAQGTHLAASELAEREKELTVELAQLALMEAGARPEEIEAAEATVARLQEEVHYLQQQESRLAVRSPVAGAVTTAWLKEKIGHYFAEGELICEVEDSQSLEVVIEIDEDDAARLKPGQEVRLKARALPFDVFTVNVVRVAPKAIQGEIRSTVPVYCELEDARGALRSGMTGFARVQHDRSPLAAILARYVLRLIRTEFWW